jgi:hypothetical protein
MHVVQREPNPGCPGPGLRAGRKRFLCQLPLVAALILLPKPTSMGAPRAAALRSSLLGKKNIFEGQPRSTPVRNLMPERLRDGIYRLGTWTWYC